MVKNPKNLRNYGEYFSNTQKVSEAYIYSQIRENPEIRAKTIQIQKDWKKELTSKFEKATKKLYQRDKKKNFQSVTFSIISDRGDTIPIEHTNLICLDIDRNTKNELNAFREKIITGNIPFVRSSGLSVSGIYNGSMWATFECEITELSYTSDEEMFKLLRIHPNAQKSEIQAKLHQAYVDYLKWYLEDTEGIIIPPNNNPKQPRYISSDPNLYVNFDAQLVTKEALLQFIKEREAFITKERIKRINQSKGSAQAELRSANNPQRWIKFCTDYSHDKGAPFKEHKRMFLFYFGTHANMLGVPKEEALNHVERLFEDVPEDFDADYREQLLYPYKKYNYDFGIKSRLLRIVKNELVINLDKGQRLSSAKDKLFEFIMSNKKTEVIAPCGVGKNFTIYNLLANDYFKKTGEKTIIVLSLNKKVVKDHKAYGLPYITGEYLKNSNNPKDVWNEALQSNVILVNQNMLPSLLNKFPEEAKPWIVIDEVQTITKAYKLNTSTDLTRAIEEKDLKVMVMTGTPRPYFEVLGFKRALVKRDNDNVDVKVRKCDKNWLLSLAKLIRDNSQNDTLLIVKKNDKKALHKAKNYLLKERLLTEDQINIIHSDISIKESKGYMEKLLNDQKESFYNRVKLVLTTSAINEGVDIHSERKVTLVTFLKNSLFDPFEFVQFTARWRGTHQNREAIIYAPKIETPQKGFKRHIPEEDFQDLLEEYNSICDLLNKKLDIKKERKGRYKHFNNLDTGKYATLTDKGYKVNYIALLVECEERYLNKCTILEGIEFLNDNYKEFNISVDIEEHTFTEIEVEEANEFCKGQIQNREDAKKLLIKLRREHPQALYQAIKWADDPDAKQGKLFNYNHSDQLIKEHPQLFNEYLDICKRYIVKREKFLLDNLDLNIKDRESIIIEGDSFRSEESYKSFIEGLQLHQLLLEYELGGLKNKRGLNFDALGLIRLIDDIPLNEKMSQSEIYKIFANHFPSKHKRRLLNKQMCMRVFKAKFEYTTSRTGKNKGIEYTATAQKLLQLFLEEYKLEKTVKEVEDFIMNR